MSKQPKKINKDKIGPAFSQPMTCDICQAFEDRGGAHRAGWRAVDAYATYSNGGSQCMFTRANACAKCSPELGAEPGIFDAFYANLLNVCFGRLSAISATAPKITRIAVWKAASNGWPTPVPVKHTDDGQLEYMRI